MDFLVKYGSPGLTQEQAEAMLDAVAEHISGLWVPSYKDENGVEQPGHIGNGAYILNIGEWALSSPFQWFIPSTTLTTTDPSGNTVPTMVPDGYWYRIFRWNADLDNLISYMNLGGGVMTTDPETNVVTIVAGPVTLTSPLPEGCPLTF